MKITLERDQLDLKPVSDVYRVGVGHDHAFQFHRKDVCSFMEKMQQDIGFKYVRFHGLFDDDMLVVQSIVDYFRMRFIPRGKKIRDVNFHQVADVLDNVLDCGYLPWVELSFMPSLLAKGKKKGLRYLNNICLPKNWGVWSQFIQDFIRFCLYRYGQDNVRQWRFEVWNEPDLSVFFAGDQKDYFHLYEVTAKAVKSVDKELLVGGPSTSGCRWISEFRQYCVDHNVPLDFLSTHHYPGDAFGNTFKAKDAFRFISTVKENGRKGIGLSKTYEDLFYNPDQFAGYTLQGLLDLEKKAVSGAKGLPLYIDEWSSMAVFASPFHDHKEEAAFILDAALHFDPGVNGAFYWCGTDVYEEQYMLGAPFHGGFGLVNNLGIPKPSYRAFELLAHLPKNHAFIRDGELKAVYFEEGGEGALLLFAPSFDVKHPKSYSLQLDLGEVKDIKMYRIDDEHANPRGYYEKLGSPSLLSKKEEAECLTESELKEEAPNLNPTIWTNDVWLYRFKIR